MERIIADVLSLFSSHTKRRSFKSMNFLGIGHKHRFNRTTLQLSVHRVVGEVSKEGVVDEEDEGALDQGRVHITANRIKISEHEMSDINQDKVTTIESVDTTRKWLGEEFLPSRDIAPVWLYPRSVIPIKM